MRNKCIPVIDLFAGPGGLGEGFSSLYYEDGYRKFDVRISIEKEARAVETLALRAFFRAFPKERVPDAYYDYLRGIVSKDYLLNLPGIQYEWEKANNEARKAILGETAPSIIDDWIGRSLANEEDWVLIGGPPCQAYSIVGRARMRGGNPMAFENDKRHFLYREYLRIIRKFQPTVFVMENVKGILSSTHGGSLIFERIREDLSQPAEDLEYEIRSFITDGTKLEPLDYVIESERYGIPQTRHRVILFGIRSTHAHIKSGTLEASDRVVVRDLISSLPKLRSRISPKSKPADSMETWLAALEVSHLLLDGWNNCSKNSISGLMLKAVHDARAHESTGGRFIHETFPHRSSIMPKQLHKFIHDARIGGVTLHESRSHMPSDLQRYLFAACYGQWHGLSPKLRSFPVRLLPDHKNLDGSPRTSEVPFEDRFRVQPWEAPSTTIVSHMAKDGHYFIHPDPSQCRSFTVREAARLQTFPDNYLFEGNRTEQYVQVGNAVPPFLARQIAEVVSDFFKRATNVKRDHP